MNVEKPFVWKKRFITSELFCFVRVQFLKEEYLCKMSSLTVLFVVGLCGKLCFCLNLTNHGNEIAHLKQLVQQLNTSLHQMVAENRKTATNNRNEINQLKNETSHLKSNFNTQSQGPIAFTAALTLNTEYLAGNTVVFDKIILNLGNAYHESYGHFTAPVR
ncbi:uncharacterized protein LOC134270442, partial [Saccostrea cucullata]|uniref:uncharacterized protein LOC134270442 n=1 Tax=Saccostrea cuccullata TaxID=36930 RepID=UPI002ED04EE2